MAKQSYLDRITRFNDGRCPVHGIGLSQIGLTDEGASSRAIVGCGRRDCDITAYAQTIDGPWTLLPEHTHLLKKG